MKNSSKNIFAVIGVIALAGLVSWTSFFRQYLQKDSVNIHLFPSRIGDWEATEIPISDHDYEILETRNAFSRIYRSPSGQKLMIFVVYSQTNRKVSHPPEICYTGSGASITAKENVVFDLGPELGSLAANRVLVDFGVQRMDSEVMFYWFKVGDTFTANYWKQQALIAFKSLFGQPSSSAMIRISVPQETKDVLLAQKVAQDFTRLIVPQLLKFLP